jgi:phosphoglycolate phosphatase-like HAD superfamily hydrolase
MKHIKLIAVNLDGVLLKDTFSPVIRKMVMHFGNRYTHRIERNVLSRPQMEAAQYVINISKIDYSIQDLLKLFFHEREHFMEVNGNGVFEDAPVFIDLLSKQNSKLVCYGGLPCTHFNIEMKQYKNNFDFYVCTNNFRPGLKEITREIYNLDYSQVLFIDDVNTVAETAKTMNIPFIGCPTNSQWGFQKEEMARTGVKYMVDSVGEITQEILDSVDDDASKGLAWS